MTPLLESHAERIVPKQFTIAKQQGWLPGVLVAAERYSISAALLLAVGSRETNLDPKYLRIPGDHGNGFGLLQVDKRSYPDWIASGKWRFADECFAKGAELLLARSRRFPTLAGERLVVRSMKGGRYAYVGAVIPNEEILERIVIASYNCGDWAYYHFSNGNDIDRGTTPGPSGKADYSADVLARREVFARLLSDIPDPT